MYEIKHVETFLFYKVQHKIKMLTMYHPQYTIFKQNIQSQSHIRFFIGICIVSYLNWAKVDCMFRYFRRNIRFKLVIGFKSNICSYFKIC